MKSIRIGLILIVVAVGIFFKDVITEGKVLIPGDIVTGMYYPWLSEKWGYEVGVPVKNPMLSDVVSQIFIWKQLVAEAYRQGGLPLWNPYSYSGYPLMANFQSGAFYPFNFLMVWFGDINGWNAMLMMGMFLGAISMFLFLKNRRMGTFGAVAGGLSYAMSLYAVTWMEFQTTAQMMVWFPLMLLSVDLMKKGRGIWRLLWPATIYMTVMAGRFEVLMYMLVVTGLYAIFTSGRITRKSKMWEFLCLGGLGLAMTAMQLLPTFEMGMGSVRFEENYISQQRFGLIPWVQLITGLAPDFFGNPATGNHWGWWHYHETVFYAGVVAVVAMVGAGFGYRNLGKYKFFWWLAIAGLMLGVDWPVGQFLYKLKVPVLSTASAGRVFLLYVTGAAIITGWWVDNIKRFSWGQVLRSVAYPLLVLVSMASTVFLIRNWLGEGQDPIPLTTARLWVTVRNSVFPLALFVAVGAVVSLRKRKLFGVFILGLILVDLTRSGWKYLPAVDKGMVFPKEQIIEFLVTENKKDIFRIDRQHGEIMPPNMWAAYGLMSPSGYDPLAQKEYVSRYSQDLNLSGPVISRYSELGTYDAAALGEFNVKYLLAIKRDEKDRIPGDKLSYKIDLDQWEKVKETEEVAILENSKYQPRVRTDGNGKIQIQKYMPGEVEILYEGFKPGDQVLLADSYYPGWKVCEHGVCGEAKKAGIFMATQAKNEAGIVIFIYRPESFKVGLTISLLAMAVWGVYVGIRTWDEARRMV